MSCDVAKFTITKGTENTFVFTIKADGSTLPMQIVEGTDTFVASLLPLNPSDTTTGIKNRTLTVTSATDGKVSLVLTSSDVSNLVSDKGSKVDRFYGRPSYKLIIECNTQNNGNFIAKVPEVYVD